MRGGGRLTPRAAKRTLVRYDAQEKLGFGGSWSFSDLPLKYSRGGGWQSLSCWSFDSCCQSEGSPGSEGKACQQHCLLWVLGNRQQGGIKKVTLPLQTPSPGAGPEQSPRWNSLTPPNLPTQAPLYAETRTPQGPRNSSTSRPLFLLFPLPRTPFPALHIPVSTCPQVSAYMSSPQKGLS